MSFCVDSFGLAEAFAYWSNIFIVALQRATIRTNANQAWFQGVPWVCGHKNISMSCQQEGYLPGCKAAKEPRSTWQSGQVHLPRSNKSYQWRPTELGFRSEWQPRPIHPENISSTRSPGLSTWLNWALILRACSSPLQALDLLWCQWMSPLLGHLPYLTYLMILLPQGC